MTENPSAADSFVTRVLMPLPEGTVRAEAEAGLRGRLAEHAAGRGDAVVEMEARLARADVRPWPLRNWSRILAWVMLVVCIPLLVWAGGRVVFAARDITGLGGGRTDRPAPDISPMLKDPTPAGRLLVEGARGETNQAARWRPLWESAPDDPRFLAQYALAYYGEHKRLSPEIMAAAERIDPDNGWFTVMEAAGIVRKAVIRDKVPDRDSKAGKAARVTVNDAEALDRALALVRKARGMPRFETYQTELHRMRMEQLRPAEDFLGSVYRSALMAGGGEPLLMMRDLCNALTASALRSSEAGDEAGFDRVVDDWLWLYRVGMPEADTLIGQLLARAYVATPLRNFRDAALQLGRDDQAARFNALDVAVREQRERAKKRGEQDPLADLVGQRGSILGRLQLAAGSMVMSPPVIREDDLKPGRLADHALLDRLFTGGVWVLIGCAAMSVAFSRSGPRSLARRMTDLLDWRDWLWILGVGVLAPIGWYVLITRFTSLSAREWAIMRTLCVQSAAQHFALFLMLVLVPLALARWRVAARGRLLGLAASGRKWDWLAVGSVALAVPVFGLERTVCSSFERISLAAVLLLGWPVLRELVMAWRHSRSSSPRLLRHHAVARAALPAWVFAMLLCGIALRVHEAEERHWVQANRLMEPPPDQPVMSRYEGDLVKVLRAETVELFKPLDVIAGK
jgi:hypothetical protein